VIVAAQEQERKGPDGWEENQNRKQVAAGNHQRTNVIRVLHPAVCGSRGPHSIGGSRTEIAGLLLLLAIRGDHSDKSVTKPAAISRLQHPSLVARKITAGGGPCNIDVAIQRIGL